MCLGGRRLSVNWENILADSSSGDGEFESPGTARDREGNRFSRRVQRYAHVGGSVGGVAARIGANYLFGTADRQKNALQLAAALGGLKGPLMKVAQLLSTIPDAIPPEYATELSQSCRTRRRPWAGRSSGGAWRPSLDPIGGRNLRTSASRLPPPPRWVRCIRRKARMDARSR